MPINSLRFFGFTLIALVVYYLVPKRAQNAVLLVASYGFYAVWAWHFPLVLLGVTLFTYSLSILMHKRRGHAQLILSIGIAGNLLVLVYLKHFGFFLDNVKEFVGGVGSLEALRGWEILFPVGLSYYALQAISFLVDSSRGQAPAQPPFIHFALYLGYFPKLLSGPIERARAFISQLGHKRIVDNALVARSFTLVMLGLARKLLIADPLAAIILGDVFRAPTKYEAPVLLTTLLAYVFMVYSDFAGYTAIVRGVSGFFGIELSANFRLPFFARNLTELWNRWHITLSSWLRDYIYLPLSRAFLRRNANPRWLPTLILPPVVTLMVSAMWHGLSRNILIWGALMGSIIASERVLQGVRPVPLQQPSWRVGLARLATFSVIVLAMVPFAAPLSEILNFWKGLFLRWTVIELDVRVIILLIVSVCIDVIIMRGKDETVFLRWPSWARVASLTLTLLGLFLISQADFRPAFVYQGF